MPKFAANLTMLFQEVPFLERFEQASKAGFKYVEYLFPYEYSPDELAYQLKTNHLQQVLFNLPPGDWAAGERGIACHPDRIEEFRAGVKQAITYAQTLGVKQINCLAGLAPDNIDASLLWETMLNNIRFAASALAQHDIVLLIEPINSRVDMPGFFIDTLDKALDLIEQANHSNIKVQFDLYHMQIMHGDLIRKLETYQQDIAHIQFADNPGRHEPGTGELNFSQIFKALDKIGYTGWASAEYVPSSDTNESLAWLRTFN